MDSMHSGFPLVSSRIFSAAIITSSLVVLGCASTPAESSKREVNSSKALIKAKAQSYQLEDEQGKGVTLKLGSKANLVSFTSTWCGSCQKHRKDFHRIYKSYEKKGIEFYFIRVGEVAKDVQADLDEEKAPHKHFFDKDGEVAEQFKIDTTPTILVYDSSGKEVYRSDVYSEEEIVAALNKVAN